MSALAGALPITTILLPEDTEELLIKGGVQAILAVCLIAVTWGLIASVRLLLKADRERIDALEKEVERRSQTDQAIASSRAELIGAIRGLQGSVDKFGSVTERCSRIHDLMEARLKNL